MSSEARSPMAVEYSRVARTGEPEEAGERHRQNPLGQTEKGLRRFRATAELFRVRLGVGRPVSCRDVPPSLRSPSIQSTGLFAHVISGLLQYPVEPVLVDCRNCLTYLSLSNLHVPGSDGRRPLIFGTNIVARKLLHGAV